MPHSSASLDSFFALGMQSALGTAQGTAAKLRFAKYKEGTRFGTAPEVTFLREGGDGHDLGYAYKTKIKSEGQLVFNARPEILGQLLALIPGGAVWDDASQPAGHTFHTGHGSYPWSTIYTQYPGSDIGHLMRDVRFTGLTFEYQTGQPLQITAPFIALHHAQATLSLTPSYASEEPFLYHHSPTFALGGGSAPHITRVMIEHTFNVEELQAQAVTLDDALVMNKDTTVEVERRYENSAVWKQIAWGGGIVPTISVPTTDLRVNQQYFSGGSLRQFDLRAPLIAWETADFGEFNPDGQTVTEVFTGRVLKGATSALVGYLKNLHASAYTS
jgi:hypothetical protein